MIYAVPFSAMRALFRPAALAAGILAAGLASAQTYDFKDIITGDTPTGGPVYATMLLEDVAADTVKFTLTPSATGDSAQFLSRLFLNIDPVVGPVTFSQTQAFVTGLAQGQDSQSFAGTDYDLLLSFDIAPPADRLSTGKSAEFTLNGSGLSASSFFVSAGPDNLFNALHIQGIPGGGSSHVTAVPEPGLMLAAGLGLLAVRLRRRKSA